MTHPLAPIVCIVALLIVAALAVEAEAQFKANYDESKVPEYELPDPLVMSDGTKVTSAEQWRSKRRAEVLELFKQHEYGAMPPKPAHLPVDVAEAGEPALGGKAVRRQITMYYTKDKSGPAVNVLIYMPPASQHKPPYPVYLAYNFNGNHTINPDPGIRMATVWERKTGAEPRTADESTRGASASRWSVERIVGRGYALATIYYGDVDPDFYDGFKNGVHALYPEYQNRPDNWTSIGAWAWGLHRVIDHFEQYDAIDAKRVIVLGHSRLGKTALWTGATDERVAVTISNNSGCGGAALARRAYGETVGRINSSFPHWFCEKHKQYNENEAAMPVDQHMLIALMAPRPVYVASAEKDQWADPRGEFLSCLHADPVFELLERPGLIATEMPDFNTPTLGTIGYHVRTGGHDVTDYDWQWYLNFADMHLKRPN